MPEVQEQQRAGGEGGEGEQVKGAHGRDAMRIAAVDFTRPRAIGATLSHAAHSR